MPNLPRFKTAERLLGLIIFKLKIGGLKPFSAQKISRLRQRCAIGPGLSL
jgi:hypothetical protein